MKKGVMFLAVTLFSFFGGAQVADAGYFTVLGESNGDVIVSDGSSTYLVDYSYECYSSSFDTGNLVYIDSYFYPSYGDAIIIEGLFGEDVCEVFSSEELNLKPYYVVKTLDSSDNVVLEDKYGVQYLVEYGIGCLSMWRYENKTIYIDIGGTFLDGIGDRIYLLDSNDDCKVWDAEELNTSYGGSYTPPPTTTTYTPTTSQTSCPANASYTSTGCVCNSGYVASGGVCITATQGCQIQYGPNSYGDNQYCYCSTGYQLNATRDYCVLIPSNTAPQTPQPSFAPDPIELCTQKLGPYGIVSGQNSCGCVAGYVLDDQQNYCVTAPQKKEPTPATLEAIINAQLQASVAATESKPVEEELDESEAMSVVSSTTAETVTISELEQKTTEEEVPSQEEKSLVQKIISWLLSFFR